MCRSISLWLTIICLAVESVAEAQGKRYGLFVGVETYDPEFLTRLRFAEDDAVELAEAFRLLDFDVTLMTNDAELPARRPSTAQKIIDLFKQRLKGLRPEDTLVVALSGHGVQYKQPRKLADGSEESHFFCPAEADLRRPETLVPLSQIYRLLEACPAERKLLIVDACRNEPLSEIGKSAREIELAPAGLSPRSVPKGMLALYSCAKGEKSYELPELSHGVFCHHILKYLRGEADPKRYSREQVSIHGLVGYVSVETKDYVFKHLDKEQFPEVHGKFTDWPLGPLHDLGTTTKLRDVPVRVALGGTLEVDGEKFTMPLDGSMYLNRALKAVREGDFWVVSPLADPILVAPFSAAKAKGAQERWAKHLETTVEIASKSTGMKFRLIPPGTFKMGSSPLESGRSSDEGPQHNVRISQPFFMGIYEVTQGEFEKVMGSNPSRFSMWKKVRHNDEGFPPPPEQYVGERGKTTLTGQDTSKFPVEYVSWYDAVEFCNKLSSQNGIAAYYHLVNVTRNDGSISSADVTISGGPGYRLPTEAEWEYACRAGSMTPFHFGDVCNGSEANVDGDNPFGTRTKGASLKRTTTVGSYLANSFGLLDMHGNVWEWCFDVADVSAYAGRGYTTIDPVKATGGKARILRGGSWHYRPMSSAFRADALPAKRGDALGFRVVYAGVKTQ